MKSILIITCCCFIWIPSSAQNNCLSVIDTLRIENKQLILEEWEKKQETVIFENYAFKNFYSEQYGSDSLIQISEDLIPENTEILYTIAKNADHVILSITISPFSETGDWYAAADYFLDACNAVYRIKQTVCYYNDNCSDDMVCEFITTYYDLDFLIINRKVDLMNSNKQRISDISCKPPYDFQFPVYQNLDALKKRMNL